MTVLSNCVAVEIEINFLKQQPDCETFIIALPHILLLQFLPPSGHEEVVVVGCC